MARKGLHIGIIPDGSRRWGKAHGKPTDWDGKESGNGIKEILRHIWKKHPEITEVTVWAMSTENFKRNDKDKQRVFRLIEDLIEENIEQFNKNSRIKKLVHNERVRVNVFGSKFDEIPQSLAGAIKQSIELTKGYDRLRLNIGLGYGGKFEIIAAALSLAKKINDRSMPANLKNISERVFERFLMIPKPLDLIIRTGGEKRLSGFMLYQAEYAELFFSDTLWPDFTTREFDRIMEEFRNRERRYGK
jgi:undecaprenyl diphosphate synthase